MNKVDSAIDSNTHGAQKEFSVLFAGDLGFGEHSMHHPRARPLQALLEREGHLSTIAGLAGLIGNADIAIANLEAPLADRFDPALVGRKNSLSWSDAAPAAKALKDVGFSALSLGNDHALDCGRPGLADTMQRLEEVGLTGFGAGDDATAAAAPYITKFRAGGQDRTLVVFGAMEYREHYDQLYRWYTNHGLPGVNPLSPKRLKLAMGTLRRQLTSPIFVVFPHWGKSYEPTSNAQREAARELVDAGADIVIGHGSHSFQPLDFVAGKPVVFGLGNSVWNTPGRYQAEDVLPFSQLASLVFSKDGSPYLRLFPIVTDNMITGFRSRPVDDSEFAAFTEVNDGAAFQTGKSAGAHFLQVAL